MGIKMAQLIIMQTQIFVGEVEKRLIVIGKSHILICNQFTDDIFCHLDRI